MQKQKLHYALCANLKDSITHRVYKLQLGRQIAVYQPYISKRETG